jgi:hypothetical protein
MHPSNLVIIGDPIVDVFLEGSYRDSRFTVVKKLVFPGGALNTYYNATNLCKGSTIDVHWGSAVDINCAEQLTRLVDVETRKVTEYWDIIESNRTHAYHQQGTVLSPTTCSSSGLLISGYNMGAVSLAPKSQALIPWDFAIVDNRYRTMDLNYIQGAKVKIWHATGKEYCKKWAQNFDWILWTNGPNPVEIFRPDGKDYEITLQVPPTEVIDPIGAGDTFVAAVGAHLATYKTTLISSKQIQAASKFAIECCQEVITQKYTQCTIKRVVDVYNQRGRGDSCSAKQA